MKVNKELKKLLVMIEMTANKCKEPPEHIINELQGYLAGRIAGEFLNKKIKN